MLRWPADAGTWKPTNWKHHHLDTYTLADPGADYGQGVFIQVSYSKEITKALESELLPLAAEIMSHLEAAEGTNGRAFTLPVIGPVMIYRSHYKSVHLMEDGKPGNEILCNLQHPRDVDGVAYFLAHSIASAHR